jgi:hypothetical protein
MWGSIELFHNNKQLITAIDIKIINLLFLLFVEYGSRLDSVQPQEQWKQEILKWQATNN